MLAFLLDFGTVMSPVGNNLRKLSTSAQLQNLPLSNGIKIVSVPEGFMAKSGAHTLTFKT